MEANQPVGQKENKKINKKALLKEIRDYALLMVLAVFLAFMMNRYVFANAVVPTGSMKPVVQPNDRLIINRLAYLFDEPKRGDIVMFKFPDNEEQDYLKRIIGLPGETVDIVDGLVYIDGSEIPLKEEYLQDPPNGDFGPFVVPEGSYFMLGDNRNISEDARFWENKFVKKEKIVGKAFFRYFPRLSFLKRAEY